MRKMWRRAGCLGCRTNASFDRKMVNTSIALCFVVVAPTRLLVMAVAVAMAFLAMVTAVAAILFQGELSWPRMPLSESITVVWEV